MPIRAFPPSIAESDHLALNDPSGTGPRTIVYIDGYNFYYGAVRKTSYKWIDFEALCRLLLPEDRIVKIRYFTALVQDRPDDPQKTVRQLTYLRAIATQSLIETHFGHFITRPASMLLVDPPSTGPRFVKVFKTEEKGSDVNLATHLLLDAFKNRCEIAVVVSNDSDLAEAVRVAQSDLGIQVGLINPHPRKRRSRKLNELPCLFFKQIPKRALADAQLPDIIRDAQGEIRKPKGW